MAAILCPGTGWRPNKKPLPPDRFKKQILDLWDKAYVCAAQSAVAVNNISLISAALSAMRVDKEMFG